MKLYNDQVHEGEKVDEDLKTSRVTSRCLCMCACVWIYACIPFLHFFSKHIVLISCNRAHLHITINLVLSRGKGTKLSPYEQDWIDSLREACLSMRAIAHHITCSYKWTPISKTAVPIPGKNPGGQPPKLSAAAGWRVICSVCANSNQSSAKLASGTGVSPMTIRQPNPIQPENLT